jgi:hypothetical protein
MTLQIVVSTNTIWLRLLLRLRDRQKGTQRCRATCRLGGDLGVQLMPKLRSGRECVGDLFRPVNVTATRQDGTEIHSPDIAQADNSVIGYWVKRSGEVHHPILRGRYAEWNGGMTMPVGTALNAHSLRGVLYLVS